MSAPRPYDDSCRIALEAIDRTLQDGPENFDQNVTEAMIRIVRVRDELIETNRATPSKTVAGKLRQLNAILSLMAGGEFGKKTSRIEQARDALAALAANATESEGSP